ncbi:MAG: hypothetical protein QM820_06005 [Minicystis sp.]
MRRPAVYVHARSSELRDPVKLGDAVRGSGKDAFLVCLLSPPASSTERDLLGKVRGVYFDGAKVDDETGNVRRLADAHAGLAAIGPAFEGAARAAEDLTALKKLRKEMESAPVEQAKKAASAELLIVVVDGPGREARVTMVDLAEKKVRVSVRRRLGIEEQGNSVNAALYRDQLEGCGLALAVRRSVVE